MIGVAATGGGLPHSELSPCQSYETSSQVSENQAISIAAIPDEEPVWAKVLTARDCSALGVAEQANPARAERSEIPAVVGSVS
jgi:hypothetical protein